MKEQSAKELAQELEFRKLLMRGQRVESGALEHSWTMPVAEKVWSGNERIHYRVRSQRVKAWRTMARLQAEVLMSSAPVFPLEGKWDVELTLPFTRNGRRDMSNYVSTVVKSVVDGLVDAGVWPDDNFRHVRVIEPSFIIQKPQASVGVWLRRIEDRQ